MAMITPAMVPPLDFDPVDEASDEALLEERGAEDELEVAGAEEEGGDELTAEEAEVTARA